jgi:hypothetical protein
MEFERVVELIKQFINKEYNCNEELDECLLSFIEELDNKLKQMCNGWCFVETYDEDMIVIAIGLNTIFVELDYDIKYTVKINELRVRKT